MKFECLWITKWLFKWCFLTWFYAINKSCMHSSHFPIRQVLFCVRKMKYFTRVEMIYQNRKIGHTKKKIGFAHEYFFLLFSFENVFPSLDVFSVCLWEHQSCHTLPTLDKTDFSIWLRTVKRDKLWSRSIASQRKCQLKC